MQRLSTNLTLFFKFFIPVFWLVFFGIFILAAFTFGQDIAAVFKQTSFRIGALVFYLSGAALFYFLLFPLKRIEADGQYIYVTNYFKSYRYSWNSVEQVKESNFLVFTVGQIVLKEAGAFGKQLPFIASNRYYEKFWQAYPSLTELRT